MFADPFRMLSHRIGVFVNLPFASLDRPGLQRRLAETGKRPGAGAP